MSQVQFSRTSNDSAVGTEIVLRDLNDRRLVFRPQVVNSDRDITRPVEGDLIWQRKKSKDPLGGRDHDHAFVAQVGRGRPPCVEYGRNLPPLHALTALYRFHAAHGVPITGTSVDASPGACSRPGVRCRRRHRANRGRPPRPLRAVDDADRRQPAGVRPTRPARRSEPSTVEHTRGGDGAEERPRHLARQRGQR